MSQNIDDAQAALDRLNATLKKNAAEMAGSQVDSGMLDNAMNQAQSAMGGALGNVGSLAESMKSQLSNMFSSASGALGSSLSQLSSSFPDAAKNLFPDVNKLTEQLGSIIPTGNIGRQEVEAKIKSLMPDAAEAISQPLAFITKNLNDTIKGMNVSGNGLPFVDLLSGLGSDALSNLTKSVGFNIGSSGDMLNAISQVTSNLSSGIAGSVGSLVSGISTGLGTVVSGVTSGINNVLGGITAAGGTLVNGLVSGISDTVKSIGGSLLDNPIASAAKNLVGSIYDALPSSMQGLVRAASQTAINGIVSNLMGDKVLGITNLMSQLNGFSNIGSAVSSYLGLEGSDYYPQYTVNGIASRDFGNANSNDINALYKAAKSICDNIESPNFAKYRDSKDLYDVLLALAASAGLVGLLSQLAQCTGSGTNYFDSRSSKTLSKSASSAAFNGDALLYRTIQTIVTPSKMTNSKKDVITLNTNMKGTSQNVTEYNAILDDYGYAKEDLFIEDYKSLSIINARNTALMSTTNTTVADEVLGSGIRSLVNSAVALF